MTSIPKYIREEFPIFQRDIHPETPLVYLDSAATTQKPMVVLNAMTEFYKHSYANIHRGIHTLAEESTSLYEKAREKVSKFINSSKTEQIVFTRNSTEAINLIASSWGRMNLNKDDLVILTEMEHHSNLVPWQQLASEKRIRLEFIPVSDDGFLDLGAYTLLLHKKPKLVSFTAMSNVLGTINPVNEIVRMAHEVGAITLVDGAQSVPHMPVDVQAQEMDFLVFSAHKMLGPTGIGVLYGKKAILESMPPYMGGGDMIKTVHLENFIPNELPHKFEAGTPAIAEAVGFGVAIDYLEMVGMNAIVEHEKEIVAYALERLEEVPGLKIFGPSAKHRGSVVAFTIDDVHPHDVAQILDTYGIAVRAGHHCAQPLHEKYGISATTRASFYLYSNQDEVDKLITGLYEVKKIFN